MNGLHYIQQLTEGKARKIFIVSSIFYISLVFCSSNILFLILSCFYCCFLWLVTRNIQEALLITFIGLLPFNKGKTLQIPLLPTDLLYARTISDMNYYVSITIADVFLVLNYYVWIRKLLLTTKKRSAYLGVSTILFILFIVYAGTTGILHTNYVVPLLSSVQLVRLLFIFLLPKVTKEIQIRKSIIAILIAFTVFECFWGGLQYMQKSRLGRYIEATSNEYFLGKVAWENPDLFRINGTFVDPDLFGTYMLMMVAFGSTSFFLEIKKTKKNSSYSIMYAFLFGISLLGVIFTGNRAIYMLLPIFLFLAVERTHTSINIVKKVLTKNVFIVVACFLFLTFPYLFSRLQGLPTLFNSSGSGTYRVQMILYSTRLGVESLFGVGLNLSPYYFATAFPAENFLFGTAYPHNLFAQIFAELGIVGLLLFLLFLYIVYRNFLLSKYQQADLPFYLSSLAYFACASLYPLFLSNPEVISFAFLCLGLAIENKQGIVEEEYNLPKSSKIIKRVA